MSDYLDHVNATRVYLAALPPTKRMLPERLIEAAQVEALLALAAAVASQGSSANAHCAVQAATVVTRNPEGRSE